MGHVIMQAGRFDREFLDNWSNIKADQLKEWIKNYTPEWASNISGIPAADIRRLALEFATARPRCAAFTNRGSSAHYNGFNNDRAVIMLNAIVGSIGKAGGYAIQRSQRVCREGSFPMCTRVRRNPNGQA